MTTKRMQALRYRHRHGRRRLRCDDWLVANYYAGFGKRKGILASSVPLDNYLSDLNASQSGIALHGCWWHGCRDPRAARCLQYSTVLTASTAVACYHHASANCAGIIVSTLRAAWLGGSGTEAEGWQSRRRTAGDPARQRQPEGKAKAAFVILTEDRTGSILPRRSEQIGADLLQLVRGTNRRHRASSRQCWHPTLMRCCWFACRSFHQSRAWGTIRSSTAGIIDRLPKNPPIGRSFRSGPTAAARSGGSGTAQAPPAAFGLR